MAVMAASPAVAQRLATYETRSIILYPEQVEELASCSFWASRLSMQSHLTLVGGAPASEALLAAISAWLPGAPAEPPDWVLALPGPEKGAAGTPGARVTLTQGDDRPELRVQPLEIDDLIALDATEGTTNGWRPRRAFFHAGFPDGIEAYCDARAAICATAFGWVDQATGKRLRHLVTVSRGDAQTTFHVRRPGADAPDAGDLVRFLGEVGVTRLAPPPGHALKDAADLALEADQSDPVETRRLGQVRGLETLPLRERIAVKNTIVAYHETGTRSAEADVVLPGGPSGQAMLLRFLPKSNDVTVEALGPAANLLPAAGPRSDIRRIPGYPAKGDGAAVRAWLQGRYPGLSVKGASRDEIVKSANSQIDKRSTAPEWFAVNYGIKVLGPKGADRRLADAHGRTLQQRGGLKSFTAVELRMLEAVLQTLGEPALKLLRDTAVVRQRAADGASSFGDPAGKVQIAGHTFTRMLAAGEGKPRGPVTSTVLIYDAADAPARFVGGRTPDGSVRVYPAEAAVFAHELAHVVGSRALAQRRFNELAASLDAVPFTRYAASDPDGEFFPEAVALFLLDPAWVQANHPELFARVKAYVRRPGPEALKLLP